MRKRKWNRVAALAAVTTMTFLNVFGNSYAIPMQVRAEEKTLVTDEELDGLYTSVSYSRDSVHDPSIVVDSSSGTKTYYVFGSHMGVSKTTDLMNWTSVTSESETSTLFGKLVYPETEGISEGTPDENEAVQNEEGQEAEALTDEEQNGEKTTSELEDLRTNADAMPVALDVEEESTQETEEPTEVSTQKTVEAEGTVVAASYNEAFRDNAYKGKVTILVDGVETEVDFGTYNASEWNTALDGYTVQGNMWAPDVIYNPTMGKWCMYLSLNGSQWNSVIILLTADSIEGPYVYQGPVIYSGFNGNNTGVITYDKTDLSLVYPGITDIPEKYKVTSHWGSYYPHAIDPCVSYDESGNLWLVYGSWSGGIYAIQLDETTGLRDYTVTYPDVDAGKVSCSSDAYFGTKIAGGAYVSGEGAYIEKIGGYWYLFVSYGFYSPDGGYEMRVFRSENINGPYTDGSGQSACYSKYEMNYGVNGTTRGEKLMSGYQWDTMSIGEISEGHNSAFVDSDGNAYVVYHTKFNDGTAGHQLRVHQLYVNEDGWLTTAPYEYAGETVNDNTLASTSWQISDIVGTYQIIIHKYGMDYANMEVTKPSNVTLNEDGTVTGDYTGTWSVSTGSYVNIVLNGVTYKGELVEQTVGSIGLKTLCFTAASTTGVNVWGSKSMSDLVALALTRNSLGLQNASNIFPVGNLIYQNISLPVTGSSGTEVTWTSSNESVLSSAGQVTVPEEDTKVTMICTLTSGAHYYEKSYEVTVVGNSSRQGDTETGKVALFEFEGNYADSLSTGITGVAEAQSSGTLPIIKTDKTLGSQVAEINFGYDSASSSNYVKFTNPLKGSTTGEATVSMAVKRSDSDVFDALWGFMDSDTSDGISGRAYLTGNAYLGFNGTGGWFDANHANTVTNAIPVGEWSLVTVAMDTTGFDIYVDGVLKYTEESCLTFGSGDGFSTYESLMNLLASADTFYLGYGSWWGSDAFRVDDLTFYNRVLSASDAAALYAQFEEKLANASKPDDTETARSLEELKSYNTYFNDFEEGAGDATVVGNGTFEDSGSEIYGQVYHNATTTGSPRTNYLQLPEDVIANVTSTGSKEMTVAFWVNVADAVNYFYSPLFSAYGKAPAKTADGSGTENTWPMFILQSRLLAQVNCAGYTDFTATENVAGANKESTAWLDDKEWHYYTAAITEEEVKIYVDGVLQNEWALDSTDGHTVAGLFSNGSDLKYVCLGGNQAWTWADDDSSYQYDDIALYSTALNQKEIAEIMAAKSEVKEDVTIEITGITVSAYNKLQINWSQVSGADGYVVYRLNEENGKFEVIKNIKDASTLSYTNVVVSGVEYTYQVAAYKLKNGKKVYLAQSDSVTAKTPLEAVNLQSVDVIDTNKVRIVWDAISDSEGYVIYRSDSLDGTYRVVKVISQADVTSYVNKVEDTSIKYYYKVRAFVTVDGNRIYGEYSEIKYGKILSGSPENLVVKQVTDKKIKFTWDKMEDVDGYVLYQYDSETGKYTTLKTVVGADILEYSRKVTADSDMQFAIRGYHLVDGIKSYSNYSELVSVSK